MTLPRLTSRAIIRIIPLEQGEDVPGFLQGLVTNDVLAAGQDAPVYAALLSAQGKTMFDFFIHPAQSEAGPGLLLDCEAQCAEDLVKRLSLYRLRRKIEIVRDETLGVGWSNAPEHKGNDPRLAQLGRRAIAPLDQLGDSADTAYLAHRLSLGIAEGRAEMADILWLETNAVDLNGVSFTKGCYIGQENTARMNWRNKVNRRLIVVPLERSQEKRQQAAYPDLGLAVDHLRVSEIPADLCPAWLDLTGPEAG